MGFCGFNCFLKQLGMKGAVLGGGGDWGGGPRGVLEGFWAPFREIYGSGVPPVLPSY